MLFRELPYVERPGAAARAGFGYVETWWPPDGLAGQWADEVARHGLSVSLINAYGGDIDAGERGFLNVPERRAEALDAFREAVALARVCGAPRINVLVGRELPGASREEQLAEAEGALAQCAALAEDAQLTILVEPINELDVPGYLVPTPAAAAELIEAVGSGRIRMLYDAYHAARAGLDPCRDVVPFVPVIDHVQYADCPGRGAPGTGTTDLRAFAGALESAGYAGAIGLELDPHGPTHAALGCLAW
jgi:hydroxypyruvate isomerase